MDKEERRKQQKEYRERRIAAGFCGRCKRPARKGIRHCQKCLNKIRDYQKKNIIIHNITRARRRAKKATKGVCVVCGCRPVMINMRCCQRCSDRNKKNKKIYRKKYKHQIDINIREWRKKHPKENKEIFNRNKQKVRETVFNHYGKECVCCGERYEFLTLDHIDGNGGKHRKEISPKGGYNRGGQVFYRWVIKNNFPNYLQALCWNCNLAKHIYGICPHQKERNDTTCPK